MWCTRQAVPPFIDDTVAWTNIYNATLSLHIDTPITDNYTFKQIGYWCRIDHDLILTPQHLIPENLSRLLIHNDKGTHCPIKHIRDHDLYDISLIQTSISCAGSWFFSLQERHSHIWVAIYKENEQEKTSPYTLGDNTLFLPKYFAPGMSGLPLFSEEKHLIWIVSQQVDTWTQAISIIKNTLLEREALPYSLKNTF